MHRVILLSADNVVEYLVETRRLPAGSRAMAGALAWGVSNVVLRVEPVDHPPLVVKQSRPQLRTKVEWFSRCERIYREADVLRALSARLPGGTVPGVLFEDRPNYILGLEAIRADHVVWKQQLLEGRLEEGIATRLGQLLGLVHATTVGTREVLPDADDWSLFDELRIDPFYRHLARHEPEFAPLIDDLIDDMARHRVCLVHADFSPKNVLVHADGVTLVDFETGHWGDPAFDLGFFLAHLLLKSLRQPGRHAEWRRLVEAFWASYREGIAGALDETAVSSRAVRHLAGCLWARVDGKSPVDYLTEPWQADYVRTVSRRWLAAPVETLEAAWKEYFQRLPC